MATHKGYIKCTEKHCSEIAEVKQASGKRASFYTVCPACGTNQGHGEARQKYLANNLKASREELETMPEKVTVSDTEEEAAKPSKNEGSEMLGGTDPIPKEKPKADTETKPKGMAKESPTAPPILLGVLALSATLITAIFATRKPTNKPKGQTA